MNLPFRWRAASRRACIALLCITSSALQIACSVAYDRAAAPAESTDASAEFSADGLLSSSMSLRDVGASSSEMETNKDAPGSSAGEIERRLVHTGALALAVPDASGARAQLAELAIGLGGYVQSERDAAIVLRIPSARFREGLESAAKVGRELSRRIDVQDVTEQYVDLELRVKNARALRDRLEALLQKCDDVKSALEVERELTRVRLEIEQLEAQLRALGQRSSFGTLEVELRQIAHAPPRSTAALPFSWLGSLGVENLLGRGGEE